MKCRLIKLHEGKSTKKYIITALFCIFLHNHRLFSIFLFLHIQYQWDRKNVKVIFLYTFFFITDKSNHENHFLGHDTFITRNNTRITAQMGGMAILPCTVRLTSPATVSKST